MPGQIVDSWVDRVVLSTDTSFGNADDVIVASVNRSGALASGASYVGEWVGTLPAGLSDSFYVLVMSDYGAGFGSVYEYLDALPNLGVSEPIAIASQPFADLVAQLLVTPTTGNIGQTIDLAWKVSNHIDNSIGRTSSDTWYDRIYLSRNDVVGDSDDVLLREERHDGILEVGESYTDAATVTLPNGFSGNGYLFVRADSRDQVYEFDYESNNASDVRPIQVLAPDLTVQTQLRTFTGVFGDTIPIDFQVTNRGDGASLGNVRDRIWLSSNATLDSGDTLLATVNAATIPLAAGRLTYKTGCWSIFRSMQRSLLDNIS